MVYHDHVTTVSPVSFDGKAQTGVVIEETKQLVEKANNEFLSL